MELCNVRSSKGGMYADDDFHCIQAFLVCTRSEEIEAESVIPKYAIKAYCGLDVIGLIHGNTHAVQYMTRVQSLYECIWIFIDVHWPVQEPTLQALTTPTPRLLAMPLGIYCP